MQFIRVVGQQVAPPQARPLPNCGIDVDRHADSGVSGTTVSESRYNLFCHLPSAYIVTGIGVKGGKQLHLSYILEDRRADNDHSMRTHWAICYRGHFRVH
jgi:hypothetical protein